MCGECGGKVVERRCCCPSQGAENVNACKPQHPVVEKSPCIAEYERHLHEVKGEDSNCAGPKQPYHIPGYDGHVPTLQARQGGTFGHDTHEILMSTNELRSELDDKDHHVCPAPLHQPYHIPGYTGHVHGLKHLVGGTYGQDTHTLLYSSKLYPNQEYSLTSKTELQQPYELCSGEDNNEVPFGYEKYGDQAKFSNSVLCDFVSNYRHRQSTEWAPAGISRPDPPIFDPPGEIYSQHTGLLPGYTAHVPGALFRCGKTFTDDSRDARRALRGDRF